MKNSYKVKKKSGKIENVLLVVFMVVFLFSGYKIIEWMMDNRENGNIQDEISQYIKVDNIDNSAEIVNENSTDTYVENNEKDYQIDFNGLKEINADCVGWIKVNNTDIDYAVVKGEDNEYYLSHNFKKENNKAGWIFADYRNKLDDTDRNIVIYGHNRKDGAMFSSLHNVLKEEWYNNEDNKYVTFITENENARYEVFSVYEEIANDDTIQTDFSNDDEYLEFLNVMKNKSIKDFGVELSGQSEILTLSTCGDNSSNRVVLQAVRDV